MHSTMIHTLKDTRDGGKGLSRVILRWMWLCIGFLLVWVFMFVIAPFVEKTPAVKPLAQFIEDTGIDASALYYTEVEEASEAELNMRHSMQYGPQGR